MLAIGLFSASWALLHVGFFTHHPVKDTPLYRSYGHQMVDGEVPYRDIRLEYPPAALPFFAVPAIGDPSQDAYDSRFEWMMLICGGGMIALIAEQNRVRLRINPASLRTVNLSVSSKLLQVADIRP